MNLPLNIDIQQILIHLLNLTILFGGLYILLYSPVKKFMDKRKEYYQGLYDEADKAKADAEELKSQYEKRIVDVDSEIADKKAKANEEAKAESDRRIAAARAEGEKIIAKAKEEAIYEKEKIVASAGDEIDSMVGVAIDKMLASKTGNDIDDFLASRKDN